MTKADARSGPDPWPSEGLPLKAAIERVSGTVLSDTHALALYAGHIKTTDENKRRIDAARPEANNALSLLLDAWNGSRLVAKGRADPLAAPVTIPAPAATGWRLRIVDPDRSVIAAPGMDRKSIFDLRFWPAAQLKISAKQTPVRPKAWLPDEVKRRRELNDIPTTITEFSRELKTEMATAVSKGVVSHNVGARHIEHLLRQQKLF